MAQSSASRDLGRLLSGGEQGSDAEATRPLSAAAPREVPAPPRLWRLSPRKPPALASPWVCSSWWALSCEPAESKTQKSDPHHEGPRSLFPGCFEG